jgi:hypothetical protein
LVYPRHQTVFPSLDSTSPGYKYFAVDKGIDLPTADVSLDDVDASYFYFTIKSCSNGSGPLGIIYDPNKGPRDLGTSVAASEVIARIVDSMVNNAENPADLCDPGIVLGEGVVNVSTDNGGAEETWTDD